MTFEQSSRLTKKFQATIPKSIREKLGLKSGDMVHFEWRGKEALLRKQTSMDRAFLQALEGQLVEWNSEADEEAYHGL